MGLRFRKSFKIAPGVRFNVGTKSAGISVGTRGASVSFNSRGGARANIGIPGTGLSYSQSLSSGSSGRKSSAARNRNSELKKLQAQATKLEKLEQNRLEVELYENKIEMIKSIHKDCDSDFNWQELADTPAPFDKASGKIGENERKAEENLNNYKPSFFARLFGRDTVKKAELTELVKKGKEQDDANYEEWENLVTLAKEVLSKNTSLYFPVIEEMRPFDDILEFGSGFEFFIYEPNWIEIDFDVNTESVVPKEIKSLTQTGRVSTKQMPKGKYYDLQQDYICSCSIRIARDMFALLPVDYVVINAVEERLDTSTGISNEEVILSVKIEKEKLNSFNLELIDPSDCMSNFECNMLFKKYSGLQPVERLIERELPCE